VTTRKLALTPASEHLSEVWHAHEPPSPATAASVERSTAAFDSRLLESKYEPLFELASGGMARVLLARRVGAGGFERLVVIKEIHRHLLHKLDFADFFRDEAKIAALIHHANVVPVVDVIEAPNELALVMEYVESVSLKLLLEQATKTGERVPASVASRILLDMLAGLDAAHELVDHDGRHLGVVHRDVSPHNLIVGVDGVARLIDFGIAKAAHRITNTDSGAVKGKYAYMSPEQASGEEVDRRSDVFAAALVMFEALTGSPLFAGVNALDTMRRVLNVPLPDLRQYPEIPAALHPTIEKALCRDRTGRFRGAAEMADALEAQVPPASHRKTAEYIQRVCGPLFAVRRTLLDDVRRRPAAVEPPPGPSAALATTGKRSRTVRVGLAGVAVAGLGLALAMRSGARPTLAEPAPSARSFVAAPPTSVPSPALSPARAPAPAPSGPPAPVAVEIQSSSVIRAVRAEGLREVRLDGHVARLMVDPWSGTLVVDADLDGRQRGRTTLAEGATHGTLTSVKPAALPPARRSELQDDPYGR
jgi:serine/threonine-protein kinase